MSSSPAGVLELYRALAEAYGPLRWWPARTRFEVIVGAFLTQNTSWKNVEAALRNLRRSGVLNLRGIREIPISELEALVRPSGYFRQKAARLKNFVDFLDSRYDGSLSRLFARPTESLRHELLNLNGVGPETADAILLYAGKKPVFVVDAYATRLLARHSILPSKAKYEEIQNFVHQEFQSLRGSLTEHYNEFHAQIVQVGKEHCGRVAQCAGCPLEKLLNQSPRLRSLEAAKLKSNSNNKSKTQEHYLQSD